MTSPEDRGEGAGARLVDGAYYQRLPARDACFLAFERPDLHMHVGATAIFEAGSLRGVSNTIDLVRLHRYMLGRLPHIPRCRQRIARIPFFRHPVWVDDDAFDIAHHARLVHVPAPGGEAELQQLAGELISRPLDRRRPLWEVWFVDGLADRERIAVVVKFHHSMADGLAGIEFTRRFLSATTEETFDDPPAWIPRPAPSRATLFRHEALRWLSGPLRLARMPPRLARERELRGMLFVKLRATLVTTWIALHPTSRTPLHRRVGPARAFAWTTIDMRDIRALRQHYGGSLNDVSLGIVSGAMSRLFAGARRFAKPPRLRSMAPTSALTREELQSSLGNRVYAPLVDLYLDEPDPTQRLARIQARTRTLAARQQGLAWDVMSDLAEWTGVRTQRLFMWLATHLRAYNSVLTLVPGPHFPLYLLGSRMLEVYPILPLLDHQTMTIGVLRYTGRLYWGVVSSSEYAEAFPPFIPQLESSLTELLAEARPSSATDMETSPGGTAQTATG